MPTILLTAQSTAFRPRELGRLTLSMDFVLFAKKKVRLLLGDPPQVEMAKPPHGHIVHVWSLIFSLVFIANMFMIVK